MSGLFEVRVQAAPFEVGAESARLTDGRTDIGAVVAFTGLCRDEAYAAAFADPASIRAAIDRAHVKHDSAIADAREIAFFPPMTGG